MKSVSENLLYRFHWAMRKVLSRDPLYVPRRVAYTLNRRLVDTTFASLATLRKNVWKPIVPTDPRLCLEYFRGRKSPRFHFCSDEIAKICSAIPAKMKEATVTAAEEIVRHRFQLRGEKPVTLEPMNWEHRADDQGGWQWDLNRHFYFATLGFAYWYTIDSRFADAFFKLSSSWLDSYIDRLGLIGWDTPFEVAARVNAWIWAYFLFLPSPDWHPQAHQHFLAGLGRLAQYLYRTIEYHNPGNHILLEAKSLAFCAGLFPEFTESSRWSKKAWRILCRELTGQICSDGVHAERSTMYQRIVAGELSELLLFCVRNECPRDDLAGIVRRMAEFESWLAGGLQDMPAIGDAHTEDSYYRFSAPLIAKSLFADGQVLPVALAAGDQTPWAIGISCPVDKVDPKPPDSPLAMSKAFPCGGYYISRWGWGSNASVLVWDCGPVGYAANPYHAHLDALSFTLCVDGVPLLIDQGTAEGNVQRVRELRETRAHNTAVVDRQNQSILAPLGARNEVWSPAQAVLTTWACFSDCDVMAGGHNGYNRLPDPVHHARTIVSMRGKYWLVFDRFEGTGTHHVEQRFHCAPSTTVKSNASGESFLLTRGGASLAIHPVPPHQLGKEEANVETQLESGLAGLSSHKEDRIQILSVARTAAVPFSLAAVLAPICAGVLSVRAAQTNSEEVDGFDIIEVLGDVFCDTVCFRRGPRRTMPVLQDWETDAKVLVLRRQGHEVSAVFSVDASVVRHLAQPSRHRVVPPHGIRNDFAPLALSKEGTNN